MQNSDTHIKVAIACGGTGGHIFPGLATAQVLQRRGHEVTLWLAGKEAEKTALTNWSGATEIAPFQGFHGLRKWHRLFGLPEFLRALAKCRRVMRARRPDVVLAMGSYTSLAPVLAARLLGIPIVLHEANVIPGNAIHHMSQLATALAIAFRETEQHLKHQHAVLTGMPLRMDLPQAATTEPPPTLQQLDENLFTILVMGGSAGAHRLNEVVSMALIKLHQAGTRLQVIHLTGRADAESTARDYATAGVPHAVFDFFHDMPLLYQRVALAICRAGASTCAELSRHGVPALLVPYPFAARQHQLANAQAMATAGAADWRLEKDLSTDFVMDYIQQAMAEPERLNKMREATRKLDLGNATKNLANLVESVGMQQQKLDNT